MAHLEAAVTIRAPVPEEALAVQELIGAGRRDTFGLSPEYLQKQYIMMTSDPVVTECREAITASIHGDRSRLYRVAEAAGAIVGVLVSRYKHHDEYDTGMPYPPIGTDAVCELGSLYVLNAWQKNRIGSRLMRSHEEWSRQYSRSPSGLVVVSTNAAAIRFYA
ncbi:MAG: GNAT family N-acetyltransferase, partial [Patescibacteria group bacterium]